MRNVVIVAGCRTPIGTIGGQFKTITSLDLSIPVMQELVKRSGIDPEIIDDTFWGCNYQRTYKENNLARVALVKAGLPVSVPGITIIHVIHPAGILPDQGRRGRLHHGRRSRQHEYSAAHGIRCKIWQEIRTYGTERLHVGFTD